MVAGIYKYAIICCIEKIQNDDFNLIQRMIQNACGDNGNKTAKKN